MIKDESGMIQAYLQQAAEQHYYNMEVESRVFENNALASLELLRPFIILKPKIFPDGDQWCALYGENLQEGVAAFGETPAKAATQFDIEWLNQKAKKDSTETNEIFPNTYQALDSLKIR